MKENDLFMQEALGHLDPELLEESEKVMAIKHRPAPVRVLTVAACICALLAVGATAAELAGVDVVETVRTMLGIKVSEFRTMTGTEGDEKIGWTATLPERLSNERFSEEFLAELESAEVDEYGLKRLEHKNFQNLEELRSYLGTAPTLNPILEQAEMGDIFWHMSADSSEEALYVHIYSTFVIPIPETEGETLKVHLSAWTGTADRSSVGMFFDNVEEASQEDYVTANGLEAVVSHLRFEPTEEEPGYYVREGADFYLEGFAYRLNVWYDASEMDEAKIEATLKTILDAFE